jgi:hypothetical protein
VDSLDNSRACVGGLHGFNTSRDAAQARGRTIDKDRQAVIDVVQSRRTLDVLVVNSGVIAV